MSEELNMVEKKRCLVCCSTEIELCCVGGVKYGGEKEKRIVRSVVFVLQKLNRVGKNNVWFFL